MQYRIFFFLNASLGIQLSKQLQLFSTCGSNDSVTTFRLKVVYTRDGSKESQLPNEIIIILLKHDFLKHFCKAPHTIKNHTHINGDTSEICQNETLHLKRYNNLHLF